MLDYLVPPLGGRLVRGLVDEARASELRQAASGWPSWTLCPSQLGILELLLTGVCSPLTGFMGRDEVVRCRERLELGDGTPWSHPIALEVSETVARSLGPATPLVLRDAEGVPLAIVSVTNVWEDTMPPASRERSWLVGGELAGLALPTHYDFREHRLTPEIARHEIAARGWRAAIAYPTRRVLHRAEFTRVVTAAARLDAGVLVQPIVGSGSPGDLDDDTRVRCIRGVAARFRARSALLALLPYAPPATDARRTLFLAIVARNFGCTHLLLDPLVEVPANDDAPVNALLRKRLAAVGVDVLPMERPEPGDAAPPTLGESDAQARLERGERLPAEFTFPEVAAELERGHAPRARRGLTVFFTGLSGSGKSTIANLLRVRLMDRGDRAVSLLDGDLVRQHLSSELGFSREHRDLNIRRIAFVAAEITKHRGIALCAPIAPFDATRREARRMVEAYGAFVLVHVDAPLEVCEARDRKGLYARARAGLLEEFTGISSPYEPPGDAEIVLRSAEMSPEAAAEHVLRYLETHGYLTPASAVDRAG